MMPFGEVQLLAVLIAAVVNMIIGSFWYSPKFLGTMWMRASKVKEREVEESEMRKTLLAAFANNLVIAYFLGLLIAMTRAQTIREAILVVLVTVIATVIPYEMSSHLWERRSLDLMVVNAGFSIISMLVAGILQVLL